MSQTLITVSRLTLYQRGVLIVFSALLVFNNYKFGDVRILEIALLALTGLEFLRLLVRRETPSRISLLFAAVIAAFFLISLVSLNQEYFIEFNRFGRLKRPLPLTISRLAQLSACWSFVSFFSRIANSREKVAGALALIVNTVSALCIVIEISWALHIGRILNSPFVYESGNIHARLRGGEVEGGPFGLMLAAVLGLVIVQWQSDRRMYWQPLPLILGIVLSRSKAGMFAAIILAFFRALNGWLIPLTRQKILLATSCIALATALTYVFAWSSTQDYINSFSDAENIVKTNLEEEKKKSTYTGLVMGRIAAWNISQRMFAANPIFGVGLGHYSLVRNDPRYRGAFPEVQEWDLTGLGLGTLLVEVGFAGTILFCFIFALLFFQLRRNPHSRTFAWLALAPLVFLLLGVQYYFLYPWIYVAVGRALSENSPETGTL